MIKRYTFLNTESEAGMPVVRDIDEQYIVRANVWVNSNGNPSYVFHMKQGDTHLLVDDYGAMNGVINRARTVKRRKDLFNRFA